MVTGDDKPLSTFQTWVQREVEGPCTPVTRAVDLLSTMLQHSDADITLQQDVQAGGSPGDMRLGTFFTSAWTLTGCILALDEALGLSSALQYGDKFHKKAPYKGYSILSSRR
jgi:hypothetical protein